LYYICLIKISNGTLLAPTSCYNYVDYCFSDFDTIIKIYISVNVGFLISVGSSFSCKDYFCKDCFSGTILFSFYLINMASFLGLCKCSVDLKIKKHEKNNRTSNIRAYSL
jgi:hypothetical protein